MLNGQGDEQLALLASILEPTSYPLAKLSEALKNAKGDVGVAAEALLLSETATSGSGPSSGLGGSTLTNWPGHGHGHAKKSKEIGALKNGRGSLGSWLKVNGSKGESDSVISNGVPREKKRKLDDATATRWDCPRGKTDDRSTPKSLDQTRNTSKVAPVNLLSILKQPITSSVPRSIPQKALHLTSQSAIDAHNLPLSFLQSPLSPSLASALYLTMMRESEAWEKHKWYLAGKWVESPHLMSGYRRAQDTIPEDAPKDAKRESPSVPEADGRDEKQRKGKVRDQKMEMDGKVEKPDGSTGWLNDRDRGVVDDDEGRVKWFYSGTELKKDQEYPTLLSLAADLIEPVINAHLNSRPRYSGEYAGPWHANVCGANRYDGSASGVGWHADQSTYLGPYCTIASLSLGTPRSFRLRETKEVVPISSEGGKDGKSIRTYEVTLGHNTLVTMDPGCQERFKHTIPPQKALDIFRPGWDIDQKPIPVDEQQAYTSRINITFRFYRPDFHPLPGNGLHGPRDGTPICKCDIPTLLRADQKAKARSKIGGSPQKRSRPGHGTASPSKKIRVEDGETFNSDVKVTAIDLRDSSGLSREEGQPQDVSEPKGSEGESQELRVATSLPVKLIKDDMVFFWQCQSPGQTGDLKGCGFFKILDLRAEGRGPCVGDG